MEDACGVKLCGMLLHLLMTYDFGNVSIGWVNFGARKNNFQYLLEKNISPIVWWREDFPTMIAIAGTDGFGVFVDTVSQAVFASETGSREMFRIARDMETLLRAVGALAIAESLVITDDLVNEVAEFAGAPEGKRFWNG